ncbi:hypothetical protein TNCV_2763041 [Trichonephila clavipes]|nr:hypothetical protein TNCV_2763041 [Trichonephila clavipes]
MPMYPDGGNLNAFSGNMGDQFNPFDRKPPTEENVNQNRPTEDSDTEDNSEEDFKPKDGAKGGLNKATSRTTSTPPATTVSDSPLKTKVIPPEYTNQENLKEFKINKTSEKGFSPLIQVYVITSGNGGAHTSIGEGGYHGSNNGYTTNGVTKDYEAAHKFEPPNIKVQAFIPQNRKPSSINDGPPFPSSPFDEDSNRNPPNPPNLENGRRRNNGEFTSETKRKTVQDGLRDAFPAFWLRKK